MSLPRARLLRTYGGLTPFTVPDLTEAQIFGLAQCAQLMRTEEMDYLASCIQQKVIELFKRD